MSSIFVFREVAPENTKSKLKVKMCKNGGISKKKVEKKLKYHLQQSFEIRFEIRCYVLICQLF